MSPKEPSLEDLLRIVGRERAAHSPERVARAERELTRRLGGTRRQAERRVGIRGAALVAFGFLLLARWVLFPLSEAEESGQLALLAFTVLMGLVMIVLGSALVTRRKWALTKHPFFTLLWRRDIKVLTAEPPLEELVLSVGAERDVHSPEEIAAAEATLAERLARARERTVKRVRARALADLIFGLYIVLVCIFAIVLMMVPALIRGPEAYPMGEGLVGTLHFWMMCWVVVVNGYLGLSLFVCGIGLRRLKDWARRATIWTAWSWFACGVAVIPLLLGWLWLMAEPEGDMLFIPIWLPVSIAVWVVILGGITGSLNRPEVKEACRPPEAGAAGRARRLARVLVLAVAVPLFALPIVAPLAAYGVWRHRSTRALEVEMAALRDSGAVIDIEEWKPPLPPEQDNAAELLRRADADLERGRERIRQTLGPVPQEAGTEELHHWSALNSLDDWAPEQTAYAERVLLELGEALALLREAAARPHANFDRDYSSFAVLFEWQWPQHRMGARLACLSASLNAHKGDFTQATADLKVALQLALFPDGDCAMMVHLSRMTVAMLAARKCEVMLRRPGLPAELLEGLNLPLREARRGLDLGRAIECERAVLIAAWSEIERGNWEIFEMEPPSRLRAWLLRPLLASRMCAALRLANEASGISEGPLWEVLPALQTLQGRIERESGPQLYEVGHGRFGPNAVDHVPSYAYVAEGYAGCAALLDSLRVAIALRRYKADNARPARALDDLVPGYLPQLPADPFTGKDLLVSREAGMVTVYSVGTNMSDDGGRLEVEPDHYERPDIGVRIAE